ncbi:MAG: restriction endonuclease subunit S [Candidatus Magnetoovum sp. WYHC-5]|nr:restriction endonuclease subunit S [Candidatus Magnetoovum sp. WYHC-5]
MKYGLTEKEIALIKGVFERIPEVESVFIYGSRAKNTFQKASDIDLAIVLQKGAKNILGKLKSDLEDLPIIYEINLTDEAEIQAGNFKDEYEKTKQVFYLKGWKITTLGEIVEVLSGGTPSTKDKLYWDGKIPWITPKDLSGYSSVYISKGERNITEEGLQNSSSQKLSKNTILFSSRAPIGYVVIAKNELTTNQGFKNIVCDEENSHYMFFYYWLRNNAKYIDKLSPGSTFSEASATIMRSLRVELPSFPEQRAIAAVLSSLDDKIELLHKQNKTLEAIAQAIFKEWFVKFNFPGTTGKMIDSELGKIPEGWRVGRLGDEFEIIMGQSPSGASYNKKGEGMIFFQGNAEFQDRFPEVRVYTTEPKRIAEKFDVLVSVRAPVGDINVAFEKCCIGRGLGAVRSKNKSYVFYKIKSIKEIFKNFEVEGTVFGAINKDSFSTIKVIIPSSKATDRFEKTITPIEQKIFNNNCQIQTLSALRDVLLPKLMKGEVRVKWFNS